jgi:hypothetical protein
MHPVIHSNRGSLTWHANPRIPSTRSVARPCWSGFAHMSRPIWQCLLPRLRIGAGTLTLIGEYGHIAAVVDTEGNMIGLHSMQ